MSEEDETRYYHEVLIECSKCGHMFEAGEKIFIKRSSITCQRCGESMAKEQDKFDEALLVKCPEHKVPLKHRIVETIIRGPPFPGGEHTWNCPVKGCFYKENVPANE